MRSSRQQGQAVVEFGIIALLLVSLTFAVVDFGLLLNTWLSVSASSRELARSASVGKKAPFLDTEAKAMGGPSVSLVGFSDRCCGPTSAIYVKVDYFAPCPPGPSCAPLDPTLLIDPARLLTDYGGTCAGATCHPLPDDTVRVTVTAQGAQVITPLIRPFFGCADGTRPTCNVALASTTVMRFEGIEF